MRILYFGSGAFGLPTFEWLLAHHEVVGVVTQPDRPAGRRRQATPTPIAQRVAGSGVEILKPAELDADTVAAIRAIEADAWVVIAYGHKIPAAALVDRFAINLHGSLLPKYRGAAPIQWAMINGERTTGVSVITLADRMDAGDVFDRREIEIDPMETAGELHDRLAQLGPVAVAAVLTAHENGSLRAFGQDDTHATRAPKLAKADGTTSFDLPAPAVRDRIHGLTPWPGCTVDLDGEPLKLTRVEVVDAADPAAEPGTIDADGIVTCRPGHLRLVTVQRPGGRPMSFSAFRRGHTGGNRLRPR